MNSSKKRFARHLIAFVILAAPALVFAQGSQPTLAEPRLQIQIPDVTFSKAVLKDGSITVPYLAQYISGIYRFLISIVGVLAGVMLMIGGFQYLTSGGDASRAKKGRERIVNAIAGVVLALGSYLILFTINPDLVEFKSLEYAQVQEKTFTLEDQEEADASAGTAAPAGALCNTTESCKTLCANPAKWPTTAPGIPAASELQVIPNLTGVKNPKGVRASAAVVSALRQVSALAAPEAYVVNISSGHRSLTRQIELVCDKYNAGLYDHVPKYVAWPGGSNHGSGNAIDVWLSQGSKKLTATTSAEQKDVSKRGATQKLAEIMTKAGFKRYSKEVWHFEVNTSTACRCQYPCCPFPANWCSAREQQLKDPTLYSPPAGANCQ